MNPDDDDGENFAGETNFDGTKINAISYHCIQSGRQEEMIGKSTHDR